MPHYPFYTHLTAVADLHARSAIGLVRGHRALLYKIPPKKTTKTKIDARAPRHSSNRSSTCAAGSVGVPPRGPSVTVLTPIALPDRLHRFQRSTGVPHARIAHWRWGIARLAETSELMNKLTGFRENLRQCTRRQCVAWYAKRCSKTTWRHVLFFPLKSHHTINFDDWYLYLFKCLENTLKIGSIILQRWQVLQVLLQPIWYLYLLNVWKTLILLKNSVAPNLLQVELWECKENVCFYTWYTSTIKLFALSYTHFNVLFDTTLRALHFNLYFVTTIRCWHFNVHFHTMLRRHLSPWVVNFTLITVVNYSCSANCRIRDAANL